MGFLTLVLVVVGASAVRPSSPNGLDMIQSLVRYTGSRADTADYILKKIIKDNGDPADPKYGLVRVMKQVKDLSRDILARIKQYEKTQARELQSTVAPPASQQYAPRVRMRGGKLIGPKGWAWGWWVRIWA